jgi:Zn-dependent protease
VDLFDLERALMYLPGIVIGLTVHEFSHAWTAHLSGDTTSKEQGRVTLNPLKHIDAIGLIFLFVAGFGWAKPVQFNEENLRKKTDVMKIAFAGPLSNAIIAVILSLIFAVVYGNRPDVYSKAYGTMLDIFYYSISINWGLFIFNLIPFPPLDGSHIFFYPLRKYPVVYNALYRYGSLLLFALLLVMMLTQINLLPVGNAVRFITEGFLKLIGVDLF